MKRERDKIIVLVLSVILCFSNILPVFAAETAELPENAENFEETTEETPLEENEMPVDEAADKQEELPDESLEPVESETAEPEETAEESLPETSGEEQKTIQIGETVTLEGNGSWVYYFTPEEDGIYYFKIIEADTWINPALYKASNNELLLEFWSYTCDLKANETYYIRWENASPGDTFCIEKVKKIVIEVGETVEFDKWNRYYYFTPTESGNYTYEYAGDMTDAYWYGVDADGSLQELGRDDTCDLSAGKEYCFTVRYVDSESAFFRIVKTQRYEIKPGDTIKLEDIYRGRYYYFTPAESGVYYLETDKDLEDDYRQYVDAYWSEISNSRHVYLNGI